VAAVVVGIRGRPDARPRAGVVLLVAREKGAVGGGVKRRGIETELGFSFLISNKVISPLLLLAAPPFSFFAPLYYHMHPLCYLIHLHVFLFSSYTSIYVNPAPPSYFACWVFIAFLLSRTPPHFCFPLSPFLTKLFLFLFILFFPFILFSLLLFIYFRSFIYLFIIIIIIIIIFIIFIFFIFYYS